MKILLLFACLSVWVSKNKGAFVQPAKFNPYAKVTREPGQIELSISLYWQPKVISYYRAYKNWLYLKLSNTFLE